MIDAQGNPPGIRLLQLAEQLGVRHIHRADKGGFKRRAGHPLIQISIFLRDGVGAFHPGGLAERPQRAAERET